VGDRSAGRHGCTSRGKMGAASPVRFGGRRMLGVAGRIRAGRWSCALGLAGKSDSEIYRFRFPHPDEEAGHGDAQPSSTLPWSTPWRVVIMSDRLAGIVESSLVTDSAYRRSGRRDWVRPDNLARRMGSGGSSRRAAGAWRISRPQWGGLRAGFRIRKRTCVAQARPRRCRKKVGLLIGPGMRPGAAR